MLRGFTGKTAGQRVELHPGSAAAEACFENDNWVYASTRDPRDPPDVLAGSGMIVSSRASGSVGWSVG